MKTTKTAKLIATLLAGLLTTMACQAVNFHVATAQDLQNALTLAAANGADDNIYLTNGYYVGSFNYNSTEARSLTILGEPGTTNTQISIDGGGSGTSMSLSCTANADITVQGVTFLRNGSTGLYISTGGGGDVLAQDARFLSPANADGVGLRIAAGQNVSVLRCAAMGRNQFGTGMYLSGLTGNATVQDCMLTTNAASVVIGYNPYPYYGGGGIYIQASGLVVVQGNSFSGNSTSYSGAGAGAYCLGTTITLAQNSFGGNSGTGNYVSGVGAYCAATSMLVSNNTFTGHSSLYGGSGSSVLSLGSGDFILIGNTIANNYGLGLALGGGSGDIVNNNFTANAGGGVSGYGGAAPTVIGNTFAQNASSGGLNVYGTTITVSNNTFKGNSGYYGGANISGTQVTLADNSFVGNTGQNQGGGANIYAYGAPDAATITRNLFKGNSCTGGVGSGQGGGLYATCTGATNSTLTISANQFTQNTASQTGGGIYAVGSVIKLSDNLVAGNSQAAAGSSGGGVWVNAAYTLDMVNNTVTANTAAGNGGGAVFQVNGLSEILNVFNNIIWGNSATGSGTDVYLAGTGQRKEFQFNDAHGMYGVWDIALNNIDLAPQFFDPVNGDYHLRNTSPCLEAGTNGAPSLSATDLDGEPRIANAIVDLGCYEYATTAAHPADGNTNFVITVTEFNDYAATWKSGQTWSNAPTVIPADYLTRAGYLMTNGGTYHNDGSSRPTNWKPGL